MVFYVKSTLFSSQVFLELIAYTYILCSYKRYYAPDF